LPSAPNGETVGAARTAKNAGRETGRSAVGGGFFGNRWWVVFASICGLLVGSGAINIFAFGVFLKPVTEDLHVGREFFSSGLILTSALTALGLLPFGWMLDHWGVRRVMMVGLVFYALGVAAYSFMTASPAIMYLAFGLAGLFGCIGSPVPYGAAISLWFDKLRGLAIGIAMAGVGLGVALIPQVASLYISLFGWRKAYLVLALTVFVISWLPVALFVREPTHKDAAKQTDIAVQGNLPGMSAAQAILHSWRFWALTVAFFLAIVAINGTLTHMVAFLTDRGISLQMAKNALSAAGIALLAGRIVSGWCLDRFFGPYVAICFFVIPMAGIGLLGSGAGGDTLALIGAVLCGIGVGAEVDIMAFLISRYFGLKAYGTVYAIMFAAFAFANGVGPSIAGWSYDRFHSYTPAFWIFEGMLVVTCLLIAPLGPYPYPALARLLPGGRTQRVPA
jgi:MFS family permease